MQKWIHIIGVSGVATSGVALMFQKSGWKVTGSDKGFFPPVSTNLQEHGINILPGFKAERLTDENGRHPELVVNRGTLGEHNPELVAARELQLNIKTYPEVLREYVVKKGHSIVVAGTYGKTTITTLLVKIFQAEKIPVSFLVGGISHDLPENLAAAEEKTVWSIIEGDEFLNSYDDPVSKFFYYNPSHLLINAMQWEHPDMFPSEPAYLENFVKLVKKLPENGLLVANACDENVVKVSRQAKCRVIYYAKDKTLAKIKPDWYFLRESAPLSSFVRDVPGKQLEIIPVAKNVLGEFNYENMLAAATLAYELGIKKERIQEACKNYQGVMRRLEIRYHKDNQYIIDDFGSSPAKARGSLQTVKEEFPQHLLVAVFEPSAGSRDKNAIGLYQGAFAQADAVIFPQFTRLPAVDGRERLTAEELAEHLTKYRQKVQIIPNDEELIKNIVGLFAKHQQLVVIFLGSHSFRGMITKLVKKLTKT